MLKVNKPHYDGNYYCAAMEKYLPSEEFYMKATAKLVKRCKKWVMSFRFHISADFIGLVFILIMIKARVQTTLIRI